MNLWKHHAYPPLHKIEITKFPGIYAMKMNIFRILRTIKQDDKVSLCILARFRIDAPPIINLDHCYIQRWTVMLHREIYRKFLVIKLSNNLYCLYFPQRSSEYLKIYKFHWWENLTLPNYAKKIIALYFKNNLLLFN